MTVPEGDVADSAPKDVSARGARGVALAGLMGAASGLVIQFVTASTLTQAENQQFITFWSLLFAVIGATGGIQNESTRAVRSMAHRGVPATGRGAPVVLVGLGMGAVVAVVVLVTAPLWAAHVLQTDAVLGVLLVAVAALAFSGHASVTGVLAGVGTWGTYSRVVAAESAIRLILVGAVAFVGVSLVGYMWASALATATWGIALLVSRGTRGTFGVRADRRVRAYVGAVRHAMLAATSTAVLVVGFPVLVSLTSDAATNRTTAPLLLAISLTRAPLLLPLNAFQGVAITHFIAHPNQRGRTLGRIMAGIAGLGVVGAALAAWIGPWVFGLLGRGYSLDPLLFAALTIAGGFLAMLTLTGTAVLAVGRHRAYSVGWVVATVTAILVLLLPIPVTERVVLSLWASPLVGVAVHLVPLLRSRGVASVG